MVSFLTITNLKRDLELLSPLKLDLIQRHKAETRLRVEWHSVQVVRFRAADPGLLEDDGEGYAWKMMR